MQHLYIGESNLSWLAGSIFLAELIGIGFRSYFNPYAIPEF
jgi:hypothetical protein